jgi:hypothetical protein
MTTREFTATVAREGGATYIELPFDPNEAWGVRERHHITGTVAGQRVRGPLAMRSGRAVLPLGATWLRDAGIAVGETVEVALGPEGPQAEDLPPDLRAALEAAPEALAFFTSLATFYRTGYLRWLAGAKAGEKRAARIAEIVELLRAGVKQR